MKDFFNELFEYTYHFNNEVIDSLLEGKVEIPEKSLQLINHTINAQQIWNARIEEKPCTTNVWEMRPLDMVKEINRQNYSDSLSIISVYEFSKLIKYKNSKGQIFENTVRDILFHIINHSTYHRGQIATDNKGHGMLPLVTDYIFYKRV